MRLMVNFVLTHTYESGFFLVRFHCQTLIKCSVFSQLENELRGRVIEMDPDRKCSTTII